MDYNAQALQVGAKEPIHTDFVLLAECHGVGGADALVHQLGNVGRLQIPFLGDCPDTAPNCVHRMCAVPIKTVGGLSPRNVCKCSFCFLADFICHDCTAFPPWALIKASTAAAITFANAPPADEVVSSSQ